MTDEEWDALPEEERQAILQRFRDRSLRLARKTQERLRPFLEIAAKGRVLEYRADVNDYTATLTLTVDADEYNELKKGA